MRRLGLLLVTVLAVWLPSPAHAQGADASGWWSELSPLPAPPDVGATDLLLQGGDPQRLLPDTGVVDQSPSPSAVGALRFHVDPGSAVGALQLSVASGGQAMDVRAYPTTTAWKPVQNGAMADAPVPELGRYSLGRLDGDALVFPDIGRLVSDNGDLSVVLLPGAADRVVVHAPGTAVLTVAPPPAAPTSAADAPAADPGPLVIPPALPQADLAALQPSGPSLVATVPGPEAAPPPVAAPAPAPVALAAAPVRDTRLVADDARTRWVVLAEGLLVLAFFGLLGQGPLARLAREPSAVEVPRGVGRFQAVRVGRAPRL
ncbi:MAG: hypothetical protein JWO12_35 [Frankiales bacterium]|nr:hypothetical protein [Frankiales bacterium]